MKANGFSLYSSSALALAVAVVVAQAGCVRPKANVAMLPIPIQIVGGDDKPRVPLVGPRWHRVMPGMSKEEVIHFVGEPTSREYDGHFTNGNVETWFYDSYDLHDGRFDPHFVKFDRGRVIYSAFDERRSKEMLAKEKAEVRKKQLALFVPPDVGFRCESNDECQSKLCLDNRCAGPRGCTRPSGVACVTDSDCCSRECVAGKYCK